MRQKAALFFSIKEAAGSAKTSSSCIKLTYSLLGISKYLSLTD